MLEGRGSEQPGEDPNRIGTRTRRLSRRAASRTAGLAGRVAARSIRRAALARGQIERRRRSSSRAAARAASMNRRSLRGSLRPGATSTPLDTSTPHGRTSRIASPTLCDVEPAGEQHAHAARRAFGEPPVEDTARTRIGRVDEDHVGRAVGRGRERGIAGRERLDHEPHALADPLHLAARLTPWSCTACNPTRDATSTTCAGRSSRNTPTVITSRGSRFTMSRTASALHLPAARREHEAERVGAERDREQRVVLVGDPADLDEHVSPASGLSRRSGGRG